MLIKVSSGVGRIGSPFVSAYALALHTLAPCASRMSLGRGNVLCIGRSR